MVESYNFAKNFQSLALAITFSMATFQTIMMPPLCYGTLFSIIKSYI